MKTSAFLVLGAVLAVPLAASAETWKNVSIIDTACLAKVKADPDVHTAKCALQCQKSGYGLLTSDGTYLKFDEDGNKKALAALKATSKADHLRAGAVGDRKGG